MSIDIIGIDNFLNLILVNEYIKPAFLLPKGNDAKTTLILCEITKAFPHLKQSINYNIYDGTIISYNNYNDYNGSSIGFQNIGALLGYPFYENFNKINNNYNTYTIKVNAKLKNDLTVHLFTNICHHITEYIIEGFNIFIETATQAFHKEIYIKLLGENAVLEVHTEIIENLSTDAIIQKLINNVTLEKYDYDTIQQFLIKLNFSNKFQKFFNSHFQNNNNIHKGILIGILLNSNNYLLTQNDTPLNDKEPHRDIKFIINDWEANLTNIINKTRVNNLFCVFKNIGINT
jgi:hypothetical protein